MRLKLIISLLAFFAMSNSINAASMDFNSVSTDFWIDTAIQDDYIAERTDDGLGVLAPGYLETYWRGNGTGRLLSWTNRGTTSGFRLSNRDNKLFSLTSFDFGNGYVSGTKPVLSIILKGTFQLGNTITETFSNTINSWTTIALSDDWNNLKSVEFIANGQNNRAVWDNFQIDESVSVPEPTALVLLAIGLAIMHRSKNTYS